MTKQDILEMKTSKEIGHTMFTHSELWDDEINQHFKAVYAKEMIDEYGSDKFFPTPQTKDDSKL